MIDMNRVAVGDKIYIVQFWSEKVRECQILKKTAKRLLIFDGDYTRTLRSDHWAKFFHTPGEAVTAAVATLDKEIARLQVQKQEILLANESYCPNGSGLSFKVGDVDKGVEEAIRQGAKTFPDVEASEQCRQFTPGQVRKSIWRLAHEQRVIIGPGYELFLKEH